MGEEVYWKLFKPFAKKWVRTDMLEGYTDEENFQCHLVLVMCA